METGFGDVKMRAEISRGSTFRSDLAIEVQAVVDEKDNWNDIKADSIIVFYN